MKTTLERFLNCAHLSDRSRAALSVAGLLIAALMTNVPAAAQPGAAGPAVWVIETEGESTWITGTLHRLPRHQGGSRRTALHFLPWWRGAVRNAFIRSDIYVQEVVSAHTQAAITAFGQGREDGEGKRLRSFLDKKTYRTVERMLTRIGVDASLLERTEPLAVLLVVAFAPEPAQESQMWGLESWLERRAVARKMRIQGLETIAERLTAVASVLERADAQRQAEMVVELSELMARDDRFGEGFDAMYEAWRQGDMDAFDAGVRDYAELSPELHEAFLIARNRLWLDRVEALIGNRRNELVAVGIAHLAGPDNLIDMLRERGHAVRRVQ